MSVFLYEENSKGQRKFCTFFGHRLGFCDTYGKVAFLAYNEC